MPDGGPPNPLVAPQPRERVEAIPAPWFCGTDFRSVLRCFAVLRIGGTDAPRPFLPQTSCP